MAVGDDNNSGWYSTNKKFLSVLFIFVVSVFLVLFYRYVLCRATSHFTAMSRANQPAESLEGGGDRRRQVETQLPFYKGLDPSIIATLPIYVYKHIDDQIDNSGKRECVVCLSTFENEEVAMFLPNCKHMFHAQCINMWFSSHSTCPICRCAAKPRVVAPELKKKSTIGNWLPFPAVELDFFHPITPTSAGTSDGSAQAS